MSATTGADAAAPRWTCPCCGVQNSAEQPGCRTCRAAQPGRAGVSPRDEELNLHAAPAQRTLVGAALILALGVAGAAWLDRLPGQTHRRALGGAAEVHRRDELREGAAAMRAALDRIRAGEDPSSAPLRALDAQARLSEGPSGVPSLAPAEQQLRRILSDIVVLQSIFDTLPRGERARRARALDAELAALQGALDRAQPSP